jgi:hypothetical protein
MAGVMDIQEDSYSAAGMEDQNWCSFKNKIYGL